MGGGGDAIGVGGAVVVAAAAPELRGAHPAPLVVGVRLGVIRLDGGSVLCLCLRLRRWSGRRRRFGGGRREEVRRRRRRRVAAVLRLRELVLEPLDDCTARTGDQQLHARTHAAGLSRGGGGGPAAVDRSKTRRTVRTVCDEVDADGELPSEDLHLGLLGLEAAYAVPEARGAVGGRAPRRRGAERVGDGPRRQRPQLLLLLLVVLLPRHHRPPGSRRETHPPSVRVRSPPWTWTAAAAAGCVLLAKGGRGGIRSPRRWVYTGGAGGRDGGKILGGG